MRATRLYLEIDSFLSAWDIVLFQTVYLAPGRYNAMHPELDSNGAPSWRRGAHVPFGTHVLNAVSGSAVRISGGATKFYYQANDSSVRELAGTGPLVTELFYQDEILVPA